MTLTDAAVPPTGASLDLTLLDDGRVMGGGQRFALRLAEHVRSLGGAARIVAPVGSRLAGTAAARGLETLPAEFPAPIPARLPALIWQAARLRRTLAALPSHTVVVGNSARCQALATLAVLGRARPPLVHLMHERDTAARRPARWVQRRAGRIVAVGGASARAYRDALGGVEVVGINNFLAAAEYRDLAGNAGRRAATGAPIIGVLARLIPEKGVLELVHELAAAPAAWSRLRVGGAAEDPGHELAVRRAARDAGIADRVELLGDLDDVKGLLASVDVLVVPSVGNEGQPTVILEALAAGLPVLVRDGVVDPAEFSGLPVTTFGSGEQLGRALAERPQAAGWTQLERRFGAEQALEGILRAAGATPRVEHATR